jgi:DNA polymerase-1
MTTKPSKLILVDGSSYLFRAFFALPPLINASGNPTGAIYGVINMLKKLVRDYPGIPVAVVFDPKGKTFRHDLYNDYKANRTKMPDDLSQQIAPLHEVIKALGFPLIIESGVEADDVIGTLTTHALEQDIDVIISTGDKDIAQLVTNKVTLINTMTNKILDPAGVQEKFGVKPQQIIDLLALMGDTSDNIPGIPKVGPKTAAKWLAQYHNLDNLIEHADEIKGKVGENLRNNLELLALSKTLVTIKCDVPVDVEPQQLTHNAPDTEKLIELFTELQFKNWLTELSINDETISEEKPKNKPVSKYVCILDKETFASWLSKLESAKAFSFDTETTSLDAIDAELVGLSFSVSPLEAAYIPLAHDLEDAPQQLDREWVLSQLQPLLNDNNKTIIGQNLKYDMAVLEKYGVTFHANLQDTMLESYVLNSSQSRHDLDTLANNHLNIQTITFEDIAGKGKKQLTFNQVPIDQATEYAAEDADITLQLHQKLIANLSENSTVLDVFNSIEMPLMPVLARMECRGVLINPDLLIQQSGELEEKITDLESRAYEIVGKEFNLSSPKQLQTILFDELNIPVLKKTPGGQPSTAESVLQDLAADYPLPEVIVNYRRLSKLKSTYTDKLPTQIKQVSGRIHTSYNQAVTATGRLSSNNPNLQNIPVRTAEGRKIRQAFITPPGYKMVAADYSQIELRIIAHISQDPGLIYAFEHNMDVHRATASEVFRVPLDQVTSDQRRSAKAINFGLLYGMSAYGLSKQLNISPGEAKHYMESYFIHYPSVHDYMLKTRETAEKQGHVETLFGRRLYTPEILSKHIPRRRAAERAAINAPMQGTAADIIKKAMICVDQWLRESKVDAHMIMQVHDELIFEIEESIIDTSIKKIRHCMEHAVELCIPLTVDIGIGNNWDEAH